MSKIKLAKSLDLEANIIACDISYRGGTLKIDTSSVFGPGTIMGAYQNYLGGGIAGRICVGSNFTLDKTSKAYEILSDRILQYFYNLNNGGGDDYMQEEYNTLERNQNLPISAY